MVRAFGFLIRKKARVRIKRSSSVGFVLCYGHTVSTRVLDLDSGLCYGRMLVLGLDF